MLGQKLMLDQKNRYQGYREFVAQGNDEDTLLFFNQKNVPAIIGDKAFRHWLNELLKPLLDAEDRGCSIRPDVTMKEVITAVAEIYKTTEIEITEVYKGPQSGREARQVAMYLCQE
jgi:hypothetical protein